MILTDDQTNQANAAITNLQAALVTREGLGSPNAKDLYMVNALYPLVTASSALCLSLGNTLADELGADAEAALSPFEPTDFKRTQIAGTLQSFRTVKNAVRALYLACANPADALNAASLMVSIFQAALGAVTSQNTTAATIVTAVQAAIAALGGGPAQSAIVGAAVKASLATVGQNADMAAAAGAAVQAALA